MKLRLLRVKKDYSQEDCCRKTKCTLRTWRRWEKGETKPSEVYRELIKKLFPEMPVPPWAVQPEIETESDEPKEDEADNE